MSDGVARGLGDEDASAPRTDAVPGAGDRASGGGNGTGSGIDAAAPGSAGEGAPTGRADSVPPGGSAGTTSSRSSAGTGPRGGSGTTAPRGGGPIVRGAGDGPSRRGGDDSLAKRGGDAARRGIKGIVGGVGEEVSTLVRQEIALARQELTNSVKQAAGGAALFGGAGLSGALAVLFLSLTGWQVLAKLIGPARASFLLASLFGGGAAVLALQGRDRMQNVEGAPRTVDSLRRLPGTFDSLKALPQTFRNALGAATGRHSSAGPATNAAAGGVSGSGV